MISEDSLTETRAAVEASALRGPRKGRLLYVINHMRWFWSHRLPLAEGARAAEARGARGCPVDEEISLEGTPTLAA
jgi:hypothetical protein